MSKKKKIWFITGNQHKFYEISNSFKNKNLNWHVIKKDLETQELQHPDLKKVAIFKLKSILDKFNLSCFIEDAGFFVESPLKGFPGVYSSYIFKTIGNEGIIKLIDNFEDSVAYFKSVIALYYQPLEKIFTFEGKVRGKVSSSIRGNQGFGFDPIFIPEKYPDKTFAELSLEQKNMISHRSKAIEKLTDFLKKS
ncbi:MAG: RdgB/HAM1 family non-canonical purine NTP pyrophosphatase [Candidatus Lokiarchaeota archaeon]